VAVDGTPLLAAYRSWRKMADTTALKRHAKQEDDKKDTAHIPLLKKNNKKIRMKQGMDQEVLGDLLHTDEEDSLGRAENIWIRTSVVDPDPQGSETFCRIRIRSSRLWIRIRIRNWT
jgi:hypothetical protein